LCVDNWLGFKKCFSCYRYKRSSKRQSYSLKISYTILTITKPRIPPCKIKTLVWIVSENPLRLIVWVKVIHNLIPKSFLYEYS
jgi:hypothetical protein